MGAPTYRHRKDDGVLCGSPALRGQKVCYFHHNQRRDAMFGARARRRHSTVRFDLPPLDNPYVIHDLLEQVVFALASDTIDYSRATAMISALRLASNELRNPSGW
jgi:hypothetical protein